jgi:diaminohydroxyphosphoribosylaminopyrimidine deaminase/5-amino-6-(5-phosphoribosylamino)uracil reductase
VTPTIVVTHSLSAPGASPLRDAGVELVAARDLPEALRALRSMGIRSLLVEGGSAFATAVFEAGVVHRLIIFQAPVMLGPQALYAFDGASPQLLARLEQLQVLERVQLGPDVKTTYAIVER